MFAEHQLFRASPATFIRKRLLLMVSISSICALAIWGTTSIVRADQLLVEPGCELNPGGVISCYAALADEQTALIAIPVVSRDTSDPAGDPNIVVLDAKNYATGQGSRVKTCWGRVRVSSKNGDFRYSFQHGLSFAYNGSAVTDGDIWVDYDTGNDWAWAGGQMAWGQAPPAPDADSGAYGQYNSNYAFGPNDAEIEVFIEAHGDGSPCVVRWSWREY